MFEACQVCLSIEGRAGTLRPGGERKRVSLAEALSTNASIYCWDNATRGLDASTALEYTRACRKLSDSEGKINVMSLYQAGNGIYDLFDKVTVIAEGHLLYYGPRSDARSYFESLGFEHIDGANTADYLTAVTSSVERRIRPGHVGFVPSTALELSAIYADSAVCRNMQAELAGHLMDQVGNTRSTEATLDKNRAAKHKGVGSRSPTVTSFTTQVKAALIREYQQRWGSQL